ncbi:flagellar basal body rod protein FlgC [Sulfitobacter aestuarii]|uniref:Flagellar basal-body rod protein FlgC n=1 Tax=Sulfitobacter aestuarii TaxID=2161676 RepID=A0ABW5U113_9RHOB
MDQLGAISKIAGSAMRVQAERLRVVSENLANADSTGTAPGADPYRRKVVSFDSLLDAASGARLVQVGAVSEDASAFRVEYDPGHPAADTEGYVKLSNVNPMIELANMREAARSYEANLNIMEAGRKMRSQLIDLLG